MGQIKVRGKMRGINIRFLPDPDLKAMIANTAISTDVEQEGYVSDDGLDKEESNTCQTLVKHSGTVLFCLTDPADGAAGQTGRTVPGCLISSYKAPCAVKSFRA